MGRKYTPERIVISVAGNYDDRLIQLIEVQFGSFKQEEKIEQAITSSVT